MQPSLMGIHGNRNNHQAGTSGVPQVNLGNMQGQVSADGHTPADCALPGPNGPATRNFEPSERYDPFKSPAYATGPDDGESPEPKSWALTPEDDSTQADALSTGPTNDGIT